MRFFCEKCRELHYIVERVCVFDCNKCGQRYSAELVNGDLVIKLVPMPAYTQSTNTGVIEAEPKRRGRPRGNKNETANETMQTD